MVPDLSVKARWPANGYELHHYHFEISLTNYNFSVISAERAQVQIILVTLCSGIQWTGRRNDPDSMGFHAPPLESGACAEA